MCTSLGDTFSVRDASDGNSTSIDYSGGDSLDGDSSGGDFSGDNSSGGDNSGGGDLSGGNTSRGECKDFFYPFVCKSIIKRSGCSHWTMRMCAKTCNKCG